MMNIVRTPSVPCRQRGQRGHPGGRDGLHVPPGRRFTRDVRVQTLVWNHNQGPRPLVLVWINTTHAAALADQEKDRAARPAQRCGPAA